MEPGLLGFPACSLVIELRWCFECNVWYDIFNCNWLPPGGSSKVHIYTQTIHRTTQSI